MRKFSGAVALIFGGMLSHASGQVTANPMPTSDVREYVTRYSVVQGTLQLSEKSATFPNLKGSMSLEFAGKVRDPEELSSVSANVYKVTNAEDFFKSNDGLPCPTAPVRWFGIVQLVGGYVTATNQVRIFLINADDYRSLPKDKPGVGLCWANTFELPK